jgi:hypothetical protein
MAEGKKSFVLYTDLIHVIRKLPNEQRGKLFLHLLEYVNDTNPVTDDILVEIAFEPIRLQLKRDLKEWEEIRQKRVESGKLGGRPKSEEKQDKAKKANGFSEKQSEAKKPVNVTVNVNDNVTIKTDEEIQNEVFIEMTKSTSWIETMCMNHKVNPNELIEHLRKFYWHCKSNDYFKSNVSNARRHFNNWIQKGNPIPKIKHSDFKGFD